MKGKIIFVGPVQEVGSNGFKKRQFAIETDDKYPQKIGFDLIKDAVDKVKDSDLGKTAEVEYNIRGNEWQGKYFVSLQAWKVVTESSADPVQQPPATADGDLPF